MEIGINTVEFSSNGKEAINKYKSLLEKPDVIIMDHRMPVMNGIDAMVEILRINKNSKIIFASADASAKEQAISMGATAFLNKPLDIQEFINIIKKEYFNKK
jgi:two-component system chemotaxis response regulator CheY